MKRHQLAAIAASTFLSQPALAQQALDLGTLILSGGFTPVEAERYGRSATVTTRTGGIGNHFGASARVGSRDSSEASFFASTRTERGGLSFSLSESRDGGWDFSGDGGERDATQRKTLVLKGDFQATESLLLGFNLRRSIEDYDHDSNSFAAVDAAGYVVDDPTQFSTRNERTVSVFAEHSFAGGRRLQRLSYERTDNDQSYNGGAPTDTKGEALKYRLTVGLNGSAKEADQLVNLMLERAEDSSSSNPGYDCAANSVALEYRGSFDSGLSLQGGLRRDNNSVFKDATTWSLGASYSFASGLRLHASAGQGVVNPSYFELYANAFGYSGNPNLQPERNLGFDVGVELPLARGRGTLDVTYFNETLEDEITAIGTGPARWAA